MMLEQALDNVDKPDLDEVLKLARADIRDLQRTVSALRDALETAHAEAQAGVARANAANAGEIVQLKATATALRDELEARRAERETAVQQAHALSAQYRLSPSPRK